MERRTVSLGWCTGGRGAAAPVAGPRKVAPLVPLTWTAAEGARSMAQDPPLPADVVAARAAVCTGGGREPCRFAFESRRGLVCRARCCGAWRDTPLADLWVVPAARCRLWPA